MKTSIRIPSVPFTNPLTIEKHMPRQQEIGKLLINFSTNVFHTCNLPMHTIEFAKECQHSAGFKDIYLYIR